MRAWGAFLAAHRLPLCTEPRSLLQGTGLRCYDHFTRSVAGRLLGLDVNIRHPTSLRSSSFSTPAARLARWEREKRRLYAASAWPDEHEVPFCVPLVASTFGHIGTAAWAFFDGVVRSHVATRAVLCDSLRSQHLHAGQHAALWQRRLSVQLRIAIGTQVMGRVHGAGLPLQVSAARRAGAAARDFEPARGVQRRVAESVEWGPQQEWGRACDRARQSRVGRACGGDVHRDGVVGTGFPRSRAGA